MDASKEIQRIALGFLIVFLLISASASYWAVVGRDSIALREDNPRLVEREVQIRRGTIYDQQQEILAETIINENGTLQRIYHHQSAYSTLGYFSFRYGTGGVENAFNQVLRGAHIPLDFNRYVQTEVLHLPQIGADIQLTLDLAVQESLYAAFPGRAGAAVVIGVPDGEILGMISMPTYNPNTLDADWETLIDAADNPFFNRALQGVYQPGGILQTPLMAASLLTQQPFDTVTADASLPITLDDLTIRCGMQPPMSDLTLTQSYAYACPRAFAFLSRQINPQTLETLFSTFRLDRPLTITGFPVEQPPAVEGITLVSDAIAADLLGQGELTVSPINLASLMTSIINQGNAPQPYILSAIRNPDEEWQSIPLATASDPIMTSDTARRLRELMAGNMREGVASAAYMEGLNMGGHAALAHSGDQVQTWFIGYVMIDNQRGAAIAMVIEDSDDLAYLAYRGGVSLRVIYDQLTLAQ
jgi:peptidoglycan glycosyltransferase